MSAILERLTQQLKDRGQANPQELAKNLLIDRGHLNKDGSDTEEGKRLGKMSPEERALNRHAKRYGGTPEDYYYDEETNSCRKE